MRLERNNEMVQRELHDNARLLTQERAEKERLHAEAIAQRTSMRMLQEENENLRQDKQDYLNQLETYRKVFSISENLRRKNVRNRNYTTCNFQRSLIVCESVFWQRTDSWISK